ncbi:hypothetical protein BKP54_09955 [Ensifer sp. 1H6]|nr:hypothetical protein BKP54_09955 [Ensifer sp. 1H6]
MTNDLPADWHFLSRESATQIENELRRELCEAHVLHGVQVQALARKQGRDDFLFRVPDRTYAQVHLTWRYEPSPDWPSTEVFASLAVWKQWLIEDGE